MDQSSSSPSPSPSTPDSSSNQIALKSNQMPVQYVFVIVGILAVVFLGWVGYRMAEPARQLFFRPKVTTTKPVEIVYNDLEHEQLVVGVDVEQSRPSTSTFRNVGPDSPGIGSGRMWDLWREMPRTATLESAATVYMDTPPSYSTPNLAATR
ncbi:uncharacterized protein EV422DRAFT_562974 [Fimicolochytrium jonesii]|uniref:uncharacterized protein n=1 Tax=Fimicolochytrium jonesii TaxID=1396493 RepID=UPI0022FED78B|nr:uncharacterized protein EV422DRAFT_562974 [Fimicolochytrium jonesii]KAI8826909.1 hypothetical protein EV422DRAFT_562974 [Fimicolochytrium jonesii]